MAADRFNLPFQQVFDSTPNVRSGGKLAFYAAGTSTPLATYSDKGLGIANANPLTLNALGQPDTAIFLSPVAYKVVLLDADNTEIWTADNVYGPQFSTIAQVQTVLGSPNGTLAGTAGSAGVPASMAWDATGQILYLCTQTGSASTAAWVAINASTAASVVPSPQGRLTLTSGTPVTTGDVSGATVIYYTPHVGQLIPIYNGASFTPLTFAELSLTLLGAAHTTNTCFDIFCFNNSGVLTMVTCGWSSDTDRGTGVGTTQLARLNGVLVNAVSISGRNGSTLYTVPANTATFLGTIRTVAAGQTEDSAVKRFVSNYYNRRQRQMLRIDPASNWTYSLAAFRQANGSAANQLAFVNCADEDPVSARVQTRVDSTGTSPEVKVGIGVDSATVNSADLYASHIMIPADGLNRAYPQCQISKYCGVGYHFLAQLESGSAADGTQTWYGTYDAGGSAVSRCGIAGQIFC